MNTQEIVEITKVFKSKHRAESSNKRRKMVGVVPSKNYVIYIKKEVDDSAFGVKNEQGTVSKGGLKT